MIKFLLYIFLYTLSISFSVTQKQHTNKLFLHKLIKNIKNNSTATTRFILKDNLTKN
jgi:hypothetical protein